MSTAPDATTTPTLSDAETASILREARERYSDGVTADQDDRAKALDDLEFTDPENQWPVDVQTQRKAANRPYLSMNTLDKYVDQVTGDIKQKVPAVKFSPHDDRGDPKLSELLNGLYRNIAYRSGANAVYMEAVDSAATCGRGWWLVLNEWLGDESFFQELKILSVSDALGVIWDHTAERADLTDAWWFHIPYRVSRDEYKARYPQASMIDFDSLQNSREYGDWYDSSSIRLSMYWRKVPETYKLYLLPDGTATRALAPGQRPIRARDVNTWRVEWMLMSGAEILEGPTGKPGKLIPIVPIWGKRRNIEGKWKTRGVVRNAKDPIRFQNFVVTEIAELMSLSPKAPYIGTAKMFEGHYEWDDANEIPRSKLIYTPDPNAPGMMPTRNNPPMPDAAHIQLMALSGQLTKDCVGIYDPTLGNVSPETSGVAISARNKQTDKTNYAFTAELIRAVEHTGRIIMEMIPATYSGEQILRIKGEDGADDYRHVNKPLGEAEDPEAFNGGSVTEYQTDEGAVIRILNDIENVSNYDVAVTVGASYATKQIELANVIQQLVSGQPELAMAMADILIESIDAPNAERLRKRIAAIAPEPLRSIMLAELKGEKVDVEKLIQTLQGLTNAPDPKLEMEMKLREKDIAIKDKEIESRGLENQGKTIENEGKLLDIQGKMIEQERREEGPGQGSEESHASGQDNSNLK
jgi:hypothetical protein